LILERNWFPDKIREFSLFLENTLGLCFALTFPALIR
jgi:hypothetical protein